MRDVLFVQEAWDEMWLHAQQNPEEEVVGALLGTLGSHETIVMACAAMVNAAKDKRSFYEVDPVQMCLLWDSVDENPGPETVVGFYHSHPFTSAEPSEADWTLAHPGYSYVICSLRDKEARSFVLGDGTREVRPNGRR